MDVMESTRVDRWLWAVRLTKTRPDAAAACRGGHVQINDRPAKPSTTVSPGDEVRVRVTTATRIVRVERVIQKRVGAADATTWRAFDRSSLVRGTLFTEPPVGERCCLLKRWSTSIGRSRPGRLVRVPVALMGCRATEH